MADSLLELETRKRRRYYLLAAILLIPIAVIVLASTVPGDGERMYRVVWAMGAVFLGFLAFLGWLFFFSRKVFLMSVVALILLAGVSWATSRLRFDGDMVPYELDISGLVIVCFDPFSIEFLPAPFDDMKFTAVEESALENADCPAFRGKNFDGVVPGPSLNRDWKTKPPELIWRAPVGASHGAFSILGNLAVTLEQEGSNEAVVCYDIAERKEKWRHEYSAFFNEPQGGPGPRTTPTIIDGEVYSYGATGSLRCVDLETGKLKWDVNTLAGNKPVMWGMSGSPLVYDNLVVVNPGIQIEGPGAVVAYDRKTGKQVWAAGRTQAGYSSPQLATIAGKQQVLVFDAVSLGSYDAEKGDELWRLDWPTPNGINVAQPIVFDDGRVFISSGYGTACAMLKITEQDSKWSVEELWKEHTLRCKFASPIFHAGYIYGLDDGRLVCIDPEDGKRKWRGDRYGHGQILLSDGVLLVMSEYGKVALVEAKPDAFNELARMPVFNGRTWNTPALAGGIAFLRNDRELAWFDLRAR